MLSRLVAIPLIPLLFFLPHVLGAEFSYYPTSLTLNSISPPITFYDPGVPGVTVSLGPNSTSASITVKASTQPFDIVANSDFIGPSPWLFIPGTDLTSATVLPSYLGRVGVANISGSGSLFSGYTDSAFLYQQITWPTTPILFANVYLEACVEYAVTSGFSILLLDATVFVVDANTLAVVDSLTFILDVGSSSTCTWNTYTGGLNVAAYTPGGTYYFLIRYRVQSLFTLFGGAYYARFYTNLANITVAPANPTFLGIFLLANASTGIYNASLSLVSASFTGNVDANIWLRNNTVQVQSSSITITASTIVTSQTSELVVTTVPPGYYSLEMWLDTTISPGSSATLNLVLKYRIQDGVYVEYPIQLNIVDPPERGGRSAEPPGNVFRILSIEPPPYIDYLRNYDA